MIWNTNKQTFDIVMKSLFSFLLYLPASITLSSLHISFIDCQKWKLKGKCWWNSFLCVTHYKRYVCSYFITSFKCIVGNFHRNIRLALIDVENQAKNQSFLPCLLQKFDSDGTIDKNPGLQVTNPALCVEYFLKSLLKLESIYLG